jgi:thiol-disulfide isomerase/thioredoxin
MIRDNSSRFSPLLPILLLMLSLIVTACGEQRFEPRQAPGFTLPLLDGGGSLSMEDYRGRVVYVTFWASWCVPCRQEMPYLAQLRERHGGDGFEVLAINVDDDVELAKAFVKEYDMPFPVLRDEGRTVSSKFKVPGFPTHFLVDRDGSIRFSGLGFDLNDVRAVTQEVATLIAEQPIAE